MEEKEGIDILCCIVIAPKESLRDETFLVEAILVLKKMIASVASIPRNDYSF